MSWPSIALFAVGVLAFEQLFDALDELARRRRHRRKLVAAMNAETRRLAALSAVVRSIEHEAQR